ncbi:hypothetical protein LEM8419_00404 [Neolewinella maritima]|uniref:3-keto-alpha-glucoside-1,2-lyase/3-keto-2-hydroxy-glucal hydratase domain-containing protein n=1 Tax=Neolewinella maritima TaxID=1383882 RepID=A0ABN8F3N0_9BACT|nr:DUF1080 domain-containing protein [Neolewinella maritima]CAH0999108.1 hypothetical protein LEM8419_00404 [Neolewinella maritima]
MNVHAALLLLGLLTVCSCHRPQPLLQEAAANWTLHGDADWTVNADAFTGRVTDTVGYVITEASYTDFELELEFRPDSTVNSGIFIRCRGAAPTATDCYELNIWDRHPQPEYRTGAIVTRSRPLAYVETIGRWNTYRIRVQSNRIRAWINGTPTADLMNDELAGGYIALQASGTGVVAFRRLQIRAL